MLGFAGGDQNQAVHLLNNLLAGAKDNDKLRFVIIQK
jgi:hypothetical protein